VNVGGNCEAEPRFRMRDCSDYARERGPISFSLNSVNPGIPHFETPAFDLMGHQWFWEGFDLLLTGRWGIRENGLYSGLLKEPL
jgi:hypothetical protein